MKPIHQGKWLCSIGFFLFPHSLISNFRDPGDAPRRLATSSESEPLWETLSQEARRTIAQRRTEELRDWITSVHEAEARWYNSQPVWHLYELPVCRPDEIREAVTEFFNMLNNSTDEYFWPLREPNDDVHWRDHGWKHVCHDQILGFWDSYCSGREPAASRAEVLGSGDEIRQLFQSAANGDPEALGIIWSRFPNPQDHTELVDSYFGEERPGPLPHPSQVAAGLVEAIFSAPDSPKADSARDLLLKLVSVSVVRGSRARKGRPRIRVPASTLRLLSQMSYCLALQIREVDRLLTKSPNLKKDRARILLAAYPWIRELERDAMEFLSYEPSKASMKIVAHLTGTSASLLEKMRLRS